MKLTAPKFITWLIAVVLGGLGILAQLFSLGALLPYAFWLVVAGFVLLVLATLLKDL